MWLKEYYSENRQGVRFSRSQGSGFAKQVADDFNPLHNEDAKLFCVPGDLLFAFTVARYGVSRRMSFVFTGMVGDNVVLQFPDLPTHRLDIMDTEGKAYLEVEREHECSSDPLLIESLTRSYVKFSGQNFPGILVPLMAEHGVMINPARPLVIYQSMEFELQRLNIESPELELVNSVLEVKGKKGNVHLEFQLTASGVPVGRGTKYMVLRGLQAYDQDCVGDMVDTYLSSKEAYAC
ncbi:MAG: DUF3581 domain-containing protein [Gammaproteobacteria bacterium]|nr:DUF3581 domain-containing protein [Gammaproteobacteria bacterium]